MGDDDRLPGETDGGLPWETEGELPWETAEAEWEAGDPEAWRGEHHGQEWPEHLAGPEYWLFKAQDEKP